MLNNNGVLGGVGLTAGNPIPTMGGGGGGGATAVPPAPGDCLYMLYTADSRLPNAVVFAGPFISTNDGTPPANTAYLWMDESGATAIPKYYQASSGNWIPIINLFVDDETPTGTINGSNTAFTLAHTPITGSLRVFLGASSTTLQRLASSAWSLSGTTLTMGTAPATGSFLRVEYRY